MIFDNNMVNIDLLKVDEKARLVENELMHTNELDIYLLEYEGKLN